MITKCSTFLFSFWIITVSAQQNYQSIVASIFKNADTDFVGIIGKKLPETEAGYTEFESKVKSFLPLRKPRLMNYRLRILRTQSGSHSICFCYF